MGISLSSRRVRGEVGKGKPVSYQKNDPHVLRLGTLGLKPIIENKVGEGGK